MRGQAGNSDHDRVARKKAGRVWAGEDEKLRTEGVGKAGKRCTNVGLAKCSVRNRLGATRTPRAGALVYAQSQCKKNELRPEDPDCAEISRKSKPFTVRKWVYIFPQKTDFLVER